MVPVVLIVDDDPAVADALRHVLTDGAYEIITAKRGDEGLGILDRMQIAMVISDERMPGMTGNDFLATAKMRYPDTVRVLLTGDATVETIMQAVNTGVLFRIFLKPWNQVEMKLAVRFDKYRLENENRKLLTIIRRQASNLKRLENEYPGIRVLDRDENGSIVMLEMTDDEMLTLLNKSEPESLKKTEGPDVSAASAQRPL